MNHWHIYLLAHLRWCNLFQTHFWTISTQTCDRLCYSWTCLPCFFCLFKNKHLNRLLQEAKTIFLCGGRTGEVSWVCVGGGVGVVGGWGGWALVFAVEALEFIRQLKRGKHGMRVWLLCEHWPNELVSTTGNKPHPISVSIRSYLIPDALYLPT